MTVSFDRYRSSLSQKALSYLESSTTPYQETLASLVKRFVSPDAPDPKGEQIMLLLADLHGYGGSRNTGGAFLGNGDGLSSLGGIGEDGMPINWFGADGELWHHAANRLIESLLRDKCEEYGGLGFDGEVGEWAFTPENLNAHPALVLCDRSNEVIARMTVDEMRTGLSDGDASGILSSFQALVHRGLLVSTGALTDHGRSDFPRFQSGEQKASPISYTHYWGVLFDALSAH